jgi:hypothetical protein
MGFSFTGVCSFIGFSPVRFQQVLKRHFLGVIGLLFAFTLYWQLSA